MPLAPDAQHALVVIDVQQGFDDPMWGRRDNPACEANIALLVDAWRQAERPVVLVRHDSTSPGSPLRPGQPGNDLAAPDPWYVLPVIMAATMFLQTKLNPTPPDPVQAKVMMVMPIVFSVMFFFFPAGLVLYWMVNNIYSIAQQWTITRAIERATAAKAAKKK